MKHILSLTINQLCIGMLLLILSACQPIQPQFSREITQSMTQSSLSYLALGDSYTIGEAVDPAQRWPVQLAAQLRDRQIAIADPTIIARTGWTTDELAAGIERAELSGKTYDLVSLLIGVNNQYRHRKAEEYRQEFRSLLQQAIAFAGGDADHVLVLSIPDWGVTPFAAGRNTPQIADEIDQFNQINREETAQAGAHYVDVTPISRQASEDDALIAVDGLHPSEVMYTAWVELALPVVEKIIIGD